MNRDELVQALNLGLRGVSGMGVLFSQAVAERLGMNSTDLECLDLIVMKGPVTAGDLAQASGLTTGAITGVIDRLEKLGYARRQPDPTDRRKVMVCVEPGIEKVFAPLYGPMADRSAALLAEYDDDQLALILDFIEKSRRLSLEITTALRAETAALKAKTTAARKA